MGARHVTTMYDYVRRAVVSVTAVVPPSAKEENKNCRRRCANALDFLRALNLSQNSS